ncbi:MAG: hypothetical protein LBS57_12330 [Treponema sp.]|jgi:hypothetical protein|nr:hypothetical protein [Treponema sp.]
MFIFYLKEKTMTSNTIFRNFLRMIPAAVCGILLLSGCPMDAGNDDDQSGTIAGVDAVSYDTAGSYSIRIKNESNRDLIAFKASLSAANILGAVPKQAGDHGLKLNTTLFPSGQSQDFSVIFLTQEDYEQYKDNLSSREQYPFTRIFAAYNASGTNETPWIVSGRLGGDNKLVINNQTQWNMELRENSPRGTTLGYAPYEANNTTLYMNQGSFYIFPVFKQYNAARDEIITIYPRAVDGIPSGDEFSFEGGNELTINASMYIINTNMSSGTAYLVVHNGSQQGITVYNGNTVQKTATGISTINAGDTRTFTILMDGSAQSGYESSKTISGWRVVNMGTRSVDIPAASLEVDYRYTVEVSGDWSQGVGAVTVGVPQKGSGKVTAEFGGN